MPPRERGALKTEQRAEAAALASHLKSELGLKAANAQTYAEALAKQDVDVELFESLTASELEGDFGFSKGDLKRVLRYRARRRKKSGVPAPALAAAAIAVLALLAYAAQPLFAGSTMAVEVRPNGGLDPASSRQGLSAALAVGTPAAQQIEQLRRLCASWNGGREGSGDFFTKDGTQVTDPLAAGAEVLYHVGAGQRFTFPAHDHAEIVVNAANRSFTLERLASSPALFRVSNFLEQWECRSLIRVGTASGRLKPRSFKSDAHSASHASQVRSSEVGFAGTWLGARLDPALKAAPHKTSPDDIKAEEPRRWFHRIEERAAALVRLSNDEQEPIQIVRYKSGEKYSYHTDFTNPPGFSPNTNRLLTLLVFLTDVENGGETHFPLADNNASESGFKPTDSFCDLTQGVSVAPKMGDALLWYNMQPANQGVTLLSKETRALHAGCAVHSGTKMAANFWFQNRHPVGSCGLPQPDEGTWEFPIECPERNVWQAEWEGKMAGGALDKAESQVV